MSGGTGLSAVIHVSPLGDPLSEQLGERLTLKLGETSRKIEALMQSLLILGSV